MATNHPLYLRTLRERRGLTQVELAAKSGVPQAHISKLETKRHPRGPTHNTAVALAQALGVPPARLRFGPDLTPIRHRLPRRRRAAPVPPEPEVSV